MQGFIALELKSLCSGDVFPVQLFANNATTFERVLESGEPVTAPILEALEKTHTEVFVRTQQCRALADCVEFNVMDGRVDCIPILVVSRLSQLVFNSIDSSSIGGLRRAARQIMTHQSDMPLSAVIADSTVKLAHPWVKRQIGVAWFMAMLTTESKMEDDVVLSATFAALVHEVHALVSTSLIGQAHAFPSVTLSILARHYPVKPLEHEMLLLYRERVDGSGEPFGYRGDQVPYLASCLGLANWLIDALGSDWSEADCKLSTLRDRSPLSFPLELLKLAQRVVIERKT